ncbi:hypothetical protein ACUALS_18725 [Vibrio sp. NH-7]
MSTIELKTIKTTSDYRNDLVALGLECEGRVFTLPKQFCSDVSIRIADSKFAARVGNSPRIAFTRNAPKNQILCKALSNLNLKGKSNLGITLTDYDFLDKRTADELVEVLISIENEYRSLL